MKLRSRETRGSESERSDVLRTDIEHAHVFICVAVTIHLWCDYRCGFIVMHIRWKHFISEFPVPV